MSSHRAELLCHLPPAVALDGVLRSLGSLGDEVKKRSGPLAKLSFPGTMWSSRLDKMNHGLEVVATGVNKTDRNALIADMSFAVALTFGVTGAVLLLSNDAPAETRAAVNATQHKPARTAMPCGFVALYATPTGAGAAAFMTF